MLWKGGRRSDNVEDQRNANFAAGAGGIGLLLRIVPYLIGTTFGRIILLIGGVTYVGARMMGVDILQLSSGNQNNSAQISTENKELVEFVSVVLADTEEIWSAQFQSMGKQYELPKLVLFKNRVQSACGSANSAMGPFYCPANHKLYIDLAFYQELKTQLGAPGDFAQAYVIAHEVGHHVQNLLGTSEKVSQAERQASAIQANQLSVKLELQADCYAGIWAHFANKNLHIVETGDIESALTAAAAVGDDKLQQQATGTIRPEKFTHGTSKQRAEWFQRGLDSGDLNNCDTFAAIATH